jgi:hypothetical protein
MSKLKGGEMICRVADLFVSVPESGGLEKRCRPYLAEDGAAAEIIIKEELYNEAHWPGLKGDDVAYMDSGWQFYVALMRRGGMMLHSSAVVLDGKAYLFSGPSGMGKSTHTRLWQKEFPGAVVINDDKPALRKIDGVWYAYGTPWCGKDGININTSAPLAGICFLRRGEENKIRRLPPVEAVAAVMTQTLWRCKTPEALSVLTDIVDKLVRDIPIYELYNRPEPAAAHLSYRTMSGADCEDKNED